MALFKGVSPVVATVVLVAAAIVVATIVTVWTSGYVSRETTSAGTAGCAVNTVYAIENAVYAQTNGNFTARLTNSGTRTVGNFTVDVELLNGTITSSLAENPSNTANVTSGQSVFLSARTGWNTTTGSPTLKSFKVRNNVCKNAFYATEDFTLQ